MTSTMTGRNPAIHSMIDVHSTTGTVTQQTRRRAGAHDGQPAQAAKNAGNVEDLNTRPIGPHPNKAATVRMGEANNENN